MEDLSPVSQALVATIGTYLLTVLGTLPVLFFRAVPRRLMDAMMGFAAGVMVAASCWSLLVPAMAAAGVVPAALGLLAGAACLYTGDHWCPICIPSFRTRPFRRDRGSRGAVRRCS